MKLIDAIQQANQKGYAVKIKPESKKIRITCIYLDNTSKSSLISPEEFTDKYIAEVICDNLKRHQDK